MNSLESECGDQAEYLRDSLLNYSQPGTFSLAFKKYYGVTAIFCREAII
jgi:hypothetical protein